MSRIQTSFAVLGTAETEPLATEEGVGLTTEWIPGLLLVVVLAGIAIWWHTRRRSAESDD